MVTEADIATDRNPQALANDPRVTVTDVTGQVMLIVKGTPLADVEKMYIIRVLDGNSGNKTRAAFELGITIKTLYNKLHEYGLFEKYQTQKKREVTVNEQ